MSRHVIDSTLESIRAELATASRAIEQAEALMRKTEPPSGLYDWFGSALRHAMFAGHETRNAIRDLASFHAAIDKQEAQR